MILLTDRTPGYCPECGTCLNSEEAEGYNCTLCPSCGTAVQETRAETILEVSENIGGLLQYLDYVDHTVSELKF